MTDGFGAETSSELTFEIVAPPEEIVEVVIDLPEEIVEYVVPATWEPTWDLNDTWIPPETTTEICKAWIYEMSALGDLKVEFSTRMLSDFIDIEWLNSTVIDMYIIPADDRQYDEGFRLESVNFTWNVTEYGPLTKDTSHIVFKLVFFEPLQISPLAVQDRLVLNLNDTSIFFVSETLKKPLDDKYKVLTTKIKRQMEDNSMT